METDIQKILEDARAQRAAIIGELIGNGLHDFSIFVHVTSFKLAALTIDMFEKAKAFNARWVQAANNREQELFFAGSANLADLENRMRYYHRTGQAHF